MSQVKLLIDTNVFIGLEDPREVSVNLSSLTQLAAKHKVGVFIHEAALDDITQDNDHTRRAISLSKIKKFPRISKVKGLSKDDLSSEFGPLNKHNDVVDATLLHALRIGVVDFLVSEDRGLHDRAKKHAPALTRRILLVADAVAWLKATYEDIAVPVRYIEEVEAHSIPLASPIFDSLREGYPEFDSWWREKCVKQMRKCWVISDAGLADVAGIVVRKEESAADTDATLPGVKILKVCTFKVRPESRGTKLGELLVRQILWYTRANQFNVVYLTTYPEQRALIELIEYYGFIKTKVNEQGEMTYEKAMSSASISLSPHVSPFDLARLNYPEFFSGPEIKSFVVPIQESYHDVLFPDLRRQFDLFGVGDGVHSLRRPGNTIRKVYLCRAPANLTQPGSILLFYKSASLSPPSQAITSVGIFEDMNLATSTAELMQLTGGRSVYSERQLIEWNASPEEPVKVINFLFSGYINAPYILKELKDEHIFSSHPQSISSMSYTDTSTILKRLTLTLET